MIYAIPPGPYKWSPTGLMDSEGDCILIPTYSAILVQHKATDLEAAIENLPAILEENRAIARDCSNQHNRLAQMLSRGCLLLKPTKNGKKQDCLERMARGSKKDLCVICQLRTDMGLVYK